MLSGLPINQAQTAFNSAEDSVRLVGGVKTLYQRLPSGMAYLGQAGRTTPV